MINNNYNNLRSQSFTGAADVTYSGTEERYLKNVLRMAGLNFDGVDVFSRSKDLSNSSFNPDFRPLTDVNGTPLSLGAPIQSGDPITDINNISALNAKKDVIDSERTELKNFGSWLQTVGADGIQSLLSKMGVPETVVSAMANQVYNFIQDARPLFITELQTNDAMLDRSNKYLEQSVSFKTQIAQRNDERLKKVVDGIGGRAA